MKDGRNTIRHRDSSILLKWATFVYAKQQADKHCGSINNPHLILGSNSTNRFPLHSGTCLRSHASMNSAAERRSQLRRHPHPRGRRDRATDRGKRRLGPCGRREPRQPRHIARRPHDPAGSRRKDGGTITTTTLADTIKTVCDAITLNYGTVKSNVRYYDFEYVAHSNS